MGVFSFFHRLHSVFFYHCLFANIVHTTTHFTGALLPPLGWLNGCVPLSLFLLACTFGFPTLLFNGVTKIILGGWRSDEVGYERGGRDVG